MATTVQTDILRTEFQVVNFEDANRKVDQHYSKLVDTSAKINDLGKKSADVMLAERQRFEAGLQKSITQTHNLNRELIQLQKAAEGKSGAAAANIFSGLDKLAAQASARMATTRARLNEINAAAARTSDPKVLDGLINDARVAQTELDKLQSKIERVAANRQARGLQGRVDLGKFGGVLGTAGALLPGELGNAASAAGLASDAAAGFGVTVGTGTLAAAGGLAAAGALIVKYSKEARQEAEARLKAEELIQGAINKQYIDGRKMLDDFAKARKDAADKRGFDTGLQRGSVADLEKQRATLEQLLGNKQTGPALNAEKFADQILAIDARIAEIQAKTQADADKAFEKRHEDFIKAQEKAAEEFAKSVEKGIDKVEDIGKKAKDVFGELFAIPSTNNPFVAVFNDAEKAIKKAHEATAGLNDELRITAERMAKTAEANALFAARLNAALEASDLRADANRFRQGGDKSAEKAADDYLKKSIERYRREEAQGLFRNPSNLNQFTGGISPSLRASFFDQQREAERQAGLFRNPIFEEQDRHRLALAASQAPLDEQASARDRFERQLEVIKKLVPENETQRAEADRKIIELGRTLDPSSITDADRNAIAQAMENQAVRVEQSETEAKAQRLEAAKVNANIDQNITELLRIAKSEGLTGVIRIVNEAEDRAKVSLGKRPSESDMGSRMDQ